MKKNFLNFIKIFVTINFLFLNVTNAQQTNEKLIQLINQKNINADDKFRYLCNISQNYADYDTIKGYKYANKALVLAKQSKSLKNEIIAYDYLAITAKRANNIKKQIEIADKCTLLAKNSKEKEIIAYVNYFNANKFFLINDKAKYIDHI